MSSVPPDPGLGNLPTSDHHVDRSRIRPPRRRASPRELRRKQLLLEAEIARAHPHWTAVGVAAQAQKQLAEMSRSNRRVLEALDEFGITTPIPPSEQVLRNAELAAIVQQAPVAELLEQISRAPGRRGRCPKLAGAASAMMLMAATTGDSHAKNAYEALTNAGIGQRWAFGFPPLPANIKTYYRHLYTITGRPRRGFRGHPLELWSQAHAKTLKAIRGLQGPDGQPLYPRFGQIGVVDATRLCAPVEQYGLNTPAYLDALRRADMYMVTMRTYTRDGHPDTVIGWILAGIVDQSSGVTLVSTINPVNEYEPRVLFREMLPELFRLWPDCPLHTLIADSTYDSEDTTRELVENYSIQPIITRLTPIEKPVPTRDGRQVRVVNGRPHCRCGPMKFHQREGFYLAEHRLRDGVLRGEPIDNTKARIRWRCSHNLCREVSLYYDNDPPSNTWWPNDPDSRPGARRRALELNRNIIESAIAQIKRHGIGTKDQRCMWAQDAGVHRLARLHLLWHANRHIVHTTGDYNALADEYQRLGLNSTERLPDEDAFATEFRLRPNNRQWTWPKEGRS